MMNRHKNIVIGIALLLGITVPSIAHAYLLPEDVLLSEEFYAPPRTRETVDVARRQARESAIRREEEQEAFFAEQDFHAAPPEEFPVHEEEYEYSDSDFYSAEDMELLRTLRLLERIESQQEVLRIQQQFHGGAPAYNPQPLAPTGAGGIVTALTMMGAVGWTMVRAGKRRTVRV